MNPRTLLLTAALLTSGIHAAELAPEDLLRQGLFEEEANRDIDKAAERYRAVITAHDKQRALAATATFRLGEIARKKSDKEAAAAAFRAVIERFPEQTDLARMSRENLTTLGLAPAETDAPDPFGDPQDIEIARLKALASSSPDLLDGTSDNGWRPLHAAAAKGRLKVLTYLLENKADPNSLTIREQLTPLQLAAIHGHLATINALLAAKAKVNARFWMKPDFEKDLPPKDERADKASGEWTALDLAILYDRREVARALIKAGTDLKQSGPDFSAFPSFTPLLEAIFLGRDEIALALVEAGAPLTASTTRGASTPLDLAVRRNPGLVGTLLKAGANPNLPSGIEEFTPLQSAAVANDLEVAKQLIVAGGDAKAVNAKGQTALHFASTPAIVDLLVSKGADPNGKDLEGLAPLDAIANRVGLDAGPVVDALVKNGAVAAEPEELLKRAVPGMVSIIREKLVYPKLWRADSVMISVSDTFKTGTWIDRVDTIPAPGSPPPSLAESIMWFFPGQNYQSGISKLKIVRRDAEGRFNTVFDYTSKKPDRLDADFPALEWGDCIEISLLSSSAALQPQTFLDQIRPRGVTVRLGGVAFERKLDSLNEYWLGDRNLLVARSTNRGGRQVLQPGQNGPQPRTVRGSPPISNLPVIPTFVDSSRISVTRKGVDQPILVDLAAKDARPFRLIDGDAIDLVFKESVREELIQNNQQLLLTSDFKLGGVVTGDGLFSTLLTLRNSQNEPSRSLVNWNRVKILRGGDPAKQETLDIAALLPEQSNSLDGPMEKLAQANRLQAGDWILIRLRGEQPTEKERRSDEDILSRIGTAAAILQARQQPQQAPQQPQQVPRPAVVPPPVEQPAPFR